MKQGALAAIFDRGSILLIQRRDVPIWVLPGGGVDGDEDFHEAVLREVLEETGLQVKVEHKVAVYLPQNRLATPTHLFMCRFAGGNPKTGPETANVRFFSIDALPDDLFHIHKEMIDIALKKCNYTHLILFSQITYLNLFKYLVRHPTRVFRFLLSKLGLPINA